MDPPTGTGGDSGAGGAGSGGAGGTGGTVEPATGPVTLTFTTATQGGEFAPDNVGAVWVADASGAWVKTLERWAWIRGKYLYKYNLANPDNNVIDAVASATIMAHRTHNLAWNLTDANMAKVPPGNYTIFIECTEDEDTPGEWAQVDFTVGAAPATVTLPDTVGFKGVSLQFTPE